MTQELDLDAVVRARIRGQRTERGWSLDVLASRCHLSPSTLSRIETGRRRVGLDQLVLIARALGTSLDALVEPVDDEDVVIRPVPTHQPNAVVWLLSRPGTTPGVTVAKSRLTGPPGREPGVHPGREWFTVLSGEVELRLGDRVLAVRAGEAAEFSTLVPHLVTPVDGPAELLSIFDHEGSRAHLPGTGAAVGPEAPVAAGSAEPAPGGGLCHLLARRPVIESLDSMVVSLSNNMLVVSLASAPYVGHTGPAMQCRGAVGAPPRAVGARWCASVGRAGPVTVRVTGPAACPPSAPP